jgi:tRNA(Arg) A34 adenosine deaminase TadA
VKVAAVQLEAKLGDVEHNLAECERMAREAAGAGAELIALPEFFTSGAAFLPEVARAALPPDGAATEMLQRVARETHAYLGGSFLCRDADGEIRNAFLLAGPDGAILAEDHNTDLADGDITAHPELKLARWAARHLDRETAAGTTLYTSCQPCGMCSGALARSGLGRVVYALSNEQYLAENPGGGFPQVPQLGPGLPDEGRAAVAGYRP